MDIEIKDSPFDIYNNDKEVHYYKKEGKTFFKVNVFLIGLDLAFVHNVTYIVHKSFPTPRRYIERSISNPNCILSMWVWGKFEVKAIVEFLNARRLTYNRFLNFDKHFKDEGVKFINVR
jgi:transcription initiation factor IIF auxiliary subunit